MYKPENSTGISEAPAKGLAAALTGRAERFGHTIIEARRDGAYVFDEKGKKYIDCISSSGIFNLGRKNQAITEALKTAVRITDQGNFPMISIEKAKLAKRLAMFTPGDLECTVFSVIRGESIDFACKLARGCTGRKELVFTEGSFFGQTGFALSLSDHPLKKEFGSLIPETTRMPFGDLTAAEKIITKETAGLFIEPLQAENGCRKAEKSYLAGLREICNKTGTLLIFDETQSGMGRCGEKFACEKEGVMPDVLVIGEALGAGMFPIAATVFTQELNRFMNAHPMIHLSTFGGSDIGCLTTIKALDEYERLKPWENAKKTGALLLNGLIGLKKNYPEIIKSVQGEGLLIGISFKSGEKAEAFCKKAADKGVLMTTGEVDPAQVIVRPSLLITSDDAETIVTGTAGALASL